MITIKLDKKIVTVIVLSIFNSSDALSFSTHFTQSNVMIAAHRGDWHSAPENSLPAIESAIRKGVEIVELDIKETADGELVLMHDTTVNRTTNGIGSVSALTLKELKSLSLRSLLGGETEITSQKIPTLREAIKQVNGRAIINLDKAWAYREKIYTLGKELNVLKFLLFKSAATPNEVENFLDRDPKILYMHVVDKTNVFHLRGFTRHTPFAWEIVFDLQTHK
jgi:glycerophosphoryl diester phosphodiesterase